MEDILQQIRESATTSSPPFTRGAGGDHILSHKLHSSNHRVHIELPDYVSKFRSPSIPLVKGEEEKELNFLIMEDILQKIRESAITSSPPFTRGAGGDHHLNHQLHLPSHRVHTKLPDYVSRFRSPSIPLAKGEEEKEFNFLIMEDILQQIRESATTSSPPFTRGA
uniref:hypothetical protein n=1 Tax=Pseudanabaena sp. 'Roaring Creek' TaxID=1681830 RepID=UPI000B2A6612